MAKNSLLEEINRGRKKSVADGSARKKAKKAPETETSDGPTIGRKEQGLTGKAANASQFSTTSRQLTPEEREYEALSPAAKKAVDNGMSLEDVKMGMALNPKSEKEFEKFNQTVEAKTRASEAEAARQAASESGRTADRFGAVTRDAAEARREADLIATRNKDQRGGKLISNLKTKAQVDKEKKDQRKEANLSLGGSREMEDAIVDTGLEAYGDALDRAGSTYGAVDENLARANALAGARSGQYDQQLNAQRNLLLGQAGAGGEAANILQSAYESNLLTGSTDANLAARRAAIAGQPSISDLARQNVAFGQGQLARQAVGAAGGMGEGGALAAQQAMASLAQAGGNMASQAYLQANQLQRAETLDLAQQELLARQKAAELERTNQLTGAEKVGGQLYTTAKDVAAGGQNLLTTTGTQETSAATGANAATGTLADANTKREGVTSATMSNVLGQALNAGALREGKVDRKLGEKLADPTGMFTSGS